MISFMKKDSIDELQVDWSEQRPDLNAEAMGVVLRIQALAKIFGGQTSEKLGELELQWWQYDVLSTLRRQGNPYVMAATDLANATMLTSGAMTNRIDRLEADKLVRRLKDDDDGRRVLVELTYWGLELVESAAAARFQVAVEALNTLTDDQRESLSDLLRLLLATHEN